MKKTILLLLVFANATYAQLKTSEFENAMQLLQGNDPEKAFSNLEILEKKFPTDAQVIFLRGFYQFRDGNQNGAMMSFSNAIKSNPKYAFAYGGRAQLFAAKGMLDKAILDISEAIKLEPKNIDFLSTRAGFYNDNEQFTEGLADMKTKIKLDPNNIMGYFEAAKMSLKSGENKADDYFAKAYLVKEIEKYSVDALYGEFLLINQRFEEAHAKYTAAITSNPDKLSSNTYGNAGIVEYKLKNFDAAINYLTKAIAMDQQSAEHRYNLATIYVDKQDFSKVKQIAEQLLAMNSEDAMANMYMAIGLKYTGNENLALDYQAKAKKLEAEQNK